MAEPHQKKQWEDLTPKEKKAGIITLAVISLFVFGMIGAATGGDDDSSNNRADSAQNSSEVAQAEEPAESEPEEEKAGFAGGMYKVGVDIPAGEYVVVGSGYLQISSDSSGSFESIVANDNYSNRTIILVKDGQYVQFSGRAYTWEEAPKVDTSRGALPDGKYKVGVDFPAGEYKLIPTGTGYYGLSSSADESLDVLLSNDNFDTERYLTVQDGQYLKLNRASLKL